MLGLDTEEWTCFVIRPSIARASISRATERSARGGPALESQAQQIIFGIWKEIAQASAVLVDITDQTPNVALELGLAHALGRPTLLVAQGTPSDHLYPAVEKVQVHGYGPAPDFAGFEECVEKLIGLASSGG